MSLSTGVHTGLGAGIRLAMRPFAAFFRQETSGSVLLLVAVLVAMAWANSPWGNGYVDLWQTRLRIGLGTLSLDKPLLLWINEGLMALFFLSVGLEIKRELLSGELSSPRKAALPAAAALGGMLVPAAFYLSFSYGRPWASGWGIPMATDIAFALGVLGLLGDRVPESLKVFLAALAIVDDIGALLVISLFYGQSVAFGALAVGAAFVLAMLLANAAAVRSLVIYLVLGAGLWLAMLSSGMHATIAGFVTALCVPARRPVVRKQFAQHARDLVDEYESAATNHGNHSHQDGEQASLLALGHACWRAETPLHHMEHSLHPWVAYVIVPVFALANAGVAIEGSPASLLGHPASMGIMVGLALGKPLGVIAFSWLLVRLGLATLPVGVGWRHLAGAGVLAGIGFTMSLFIAQLAFEDAFLLASAKASIFAGSLASGCAGWLLLRGSLESRRPG